jgi:hypothetical protein
MRVFPPLCYNIGNRAPVFCTGRDSSFEPVGARGRGVGTIPRRYLHGAA